MNPTADLFLAAGDLQRQLNLQTTPTQPQPVARSASTGIALTLLAVVASALALLLTTSSTPGHTTPATVSSTMTPTTDPAPAWVRQLEHDPLR